MVGFSSPPPLQEHSAYPPRRARGVQLHGDGVGQGRDDKVTSSSLQVPHSSYLSLRSEGTDPLSGKAPRGSCYIRTAFPPYHKTDTIAPASKKRNLYFPPRKQLSPVVMAKQQAPYHYKVRFLRHRTELFQKLPESEGINSLTAAKRRLCVRSSNPLNKVTVLWSFRRPEAHQDERVKCSLFFLSFHPSFLSKTRFPYRAKAVFELELKILLSLPPNCKDYRCGHTSSF